MSIDQRALTFNSSTDALFRAWGSGLASAFQACGLIKHTDTGQIDFTTVTRAINQNNEVIFGYEIYRFNDSLQATKPIFVKVEYGTYENSVNNVTGIPAIYITTATSTNGAGTLSGVLISARTKVAGGPAASPSSGITGNSTPTNNTPVWTSGDGSWIGMVIGASATAQFTLPYATSTPSFSSFPAFIVIDRTRDLTGAITGDGMVLMTAYWPPTGIAQTLVATFPTMTFQMISFTGSGVGVQDNYWPFLMPGTAFGTGSQGGDLYTWPLPLATPKGQPQCLAVLGTYKTDVALGSQISLTVLQGVRNYISLASIAGVSNNDAARGYVNNSIPSGAVLMRWE